ncbi:hypothetical protein BAUCODRAFT_186635 [Baudoinia panamericana UAMH 10762]|uniref:Transcription elongation factor Eaf N-terminal domain-containing protein n=1 Tax=Baudoinia panamericana (strain UAMH 10762) TaxID=717646 RepID=M2NNM6_BAUPA|nr:uncharacterized protein BAUCODRAFT_186635 [Baudoinia panamericana UAMH 10762]EMD00841.1 hypothetical protein BAUCODRAFT_186635 [Baudoinia panamericana UAMH 10762]
MAASAVALPARSIDLTTPSTYPLRLGESILNTPKASSYTSVRLNHKPTFADGPKATASIKPSSGTNSHQLAIEDGNKKYKYAGACDVADNSYVLNVRKHGSEYLATLDRLSNVYSFNLTSTTDEANSRKLREQYPQLSLNEVEEDGPGGDESLEQQPADPANPFDYRHFLSEAPLQKARQTNNEAPRSLTNTPLLQPASTTTSSRPVKRPANSALVQQKKRKIVPSTLDKPNLKPNLKRVKAGQEAAATASQKSAVNKSTKTGPTLPSIKLDRKASLRKQSYDDDSGELILENDTPVTEKPSFSRTAMALALSGELGTGPISLRSAANTPASKVASPMPIRPDGMDEDGEFEIEGRSDEDAQEVPDDGRRRHDQSREEDDEDADVEDFELPSPARAHRKASVAAVPNAGGDDDDLDAQLEAAMAEAEVVEAEEESEEE